MLVNPPQACEWPGEGPISLGLQPREDCPSSGHSKSHRGNRCVINWRAGIKSVVYYDTQVTGQLKQWCSICDRCAIFTSLQVNMCIIVYIVRRLTENSSIINRYSTSRHEKIWNIPVLLTFWNPLLSQQFIKSRQLNQTSTVTLEDTRITSTVF